MLEVHDLGTLKKIVSKKNPRPGPIAFIGMGLLNPTRLFVLHYDTRSPQAFFCPSFLKIPDLTASELRPEIKNGNNPLWTGFASGETLAEGSMDEAGMVAAVRHLGNSPSGLHHYITKDSGKLKYLHSHEDVTTPGVSLGGSFVLARGFVIDAGTQTNRYRAIGNGANPYRLVPVAGYPAFAEFGYEHPAQVFRVFGLPALNKLVTPPLPTAVSNRLSHPVAEDQTEIMLASAYCDRIAYILPKEKRVIIFPLGLKGGEAGSGFAEPGKSFARKLNLPEGSTVTVQSGPAGLRVDEKTNTLLWDVPQDFKTGQTLQVIMLIKKPDSTEEYAVEKITVP